MWNRRNITNKGHIQTRSGNRPNGGLAPGTRPLDQHGHILHAMVHGLLTGFFRRNLSSKWRTFTRTVKSGCAAGRPANRIPDLIGKTDERIIEGCLDMRNGVRNILAHAALYACPSGFRICHIFNLALLLLAGHGAARPLARTCIGLGSLPANRETLTVAQATVATQIG